MYSAVPPPEQDPSVVEKDGTKEKESPPRGISRETWEVRNVFVKCPHNPIH